MGIEQLGLVDGDDDPEVVVRGGRGEVGDDVGERLAVGVVDVPAQPDAAAGDGHRHRVDGAQRSRHLRSGAEVLGDPTGLAQEREDRVLATDRLLAHDPEALVLTDRGRAWPAGRSCRRHGGRSGSGAGQTERTGCDEADGGPVEDRVVADQRRRWGARPGCIGVGDRVVPFSGHAGSLARSAKASTSLESSPGAGRQEPSITTEAAAPARTTTAPGGTASGSHSATIEPPKPAPVQARAVDARAADEVVHEPVEHGRGHLEVVTQGPVPVDEQPRRRGRRHPRATPPPSPGRGPPRSRRVGPDAGRRDR